MEKTKKVKVKSLKKHVFDGEEREKDKTYEVSAEEASDLETLGFVQISGQKTGQQTGSTETGSTETGSTETGNDKK